MIHYYRCLGSDSWRHLNGPVCDNRPVRQDLLDEVVWQEIVRLLEEPGLIQNEINRRLEAARRSDPSQMREKDLRRGLTRIRRSIERLVNAYQEELITIDELRERMPTLRQQQQAADAELKCVVDQTQDRETYLRLAETLGAFLSRLRSSAQALDIVERQRVVQLLVKEVLVGDDTIIIRHSIPVPSRPPSGENHPPKDGGGSTDEKSYLLRSGIWEPHDYGNLSPCGR